MPETDLPIVIVGAGLAGLQCAVDLHRNGFSVLLLDAADHVGGRVWTDVVDGFLLDRGFQVLNPAYPALQPWLPYLTLKPFMAGARVVLPDGQHTTVADPRRHPALAWSTVTSPLASIRDKLGLFALMLKRSPLPLALHRLSALPSPPVNRMLPNVVSSRFIQCFFRPFFGGVLLEYDGHSRWDYWLWLFHLFTKAQVALPEGGMAALPRAMAAQLPVDAIRLGTTVTSVTANQVALVTGERIDARAVVLATDGHTATRLLHLPFNPGRRGVTCLYYRWQGPLPGTLPILWLNGQGEGLVNNWCFPNVVQTGYAPTGEGFTHLLSVSVLGIPDCHDAELDRLVRAELGMLMPTLPTLDLLRIYRIPYAQPDQPACEQDVSQQVDGVWLAGDWMATPSIQGALASGHAVAEHIASKNA
jgi:phytoene dehydrogenase-like protein